MSDEITHYPAIFEGMTIRRAWHQERWFFSVIDVVGLLSEAATPRNYWAMLKLRLANEEGFVEVLTKCEQLKMEAADGKQRLTDCADAETLLRIVQSIPSPRAEPVKHWLATVGTERLEEMENPSRAIDRARQYYLAQGYSDEWIKARLRSIVARDDVTEEWRMRGANERKEFAVLTDTLHQGAFDITTAEHKDIKHLKKQNNLRDSMTAVELALTTLAEATASALHQRRDSHGFGELHDDTRAAGRVAGNARRDIEEQLGAPVVSSENYLNLTSPYRQGQLMIPPDNEDK